ncbi:MAG: hypothetical protein ACPF9L_04815, partial [Candidatus Poseidoniaceae archaeon]
MRKLSSILIIFLFLLAGCTSSESNEIADANDEEVIPQDNGNDSNQSIGNDVDQSEETDDSEKYGIQESSTFFTWNRCSPLLESTLLENQSFYDVFDDSNLDLSICDSKYQHYEIDSSTSFSLPVRFTIDFSENGTT